jgi:hypothetical protein
MKAIYTPLMLSALLLIGACTSESNKAPDNSTPVENANEIMGRWKLTKQEQMKSPEAGVQYSNQPTNIILHLQKNGYFIIYDTFIDPSWKEKGLPLILQRSKGQWELNGKQLSLTHLSDDSTYSEVLEVTSIDDHQLVTRGKDKKSNIYKTYGK